MTQNFESQRTVVGIDDFLKTARMLKPLTYKETSRDMSYAICSLQLASVVQSMNVLNTKTITKRCFRDFFFFFCFCLLYKHPPFTLVNAGIIPELITHKISNCQDSTETIL